MGRGFSRPCTLRMHLCRTNKSHRILRKHEEQFSRDDGLLGQQSHHVHDVHANTLLAVYGTLLHWVHSPCCGCCQASPITRVLQLALQSICPRTQGAVWPSWRWHMLPSPHLHQAVEPVVGKIFPCQILRFRSCSSAFSMAVHVTVRHFSRLLQSFSRSSSASFDPLPRLH